MAPIQHINNHNAVQDPNHEAHESNNLIVKLYSHLLANNAVQNSLKQIKTFSQPLIGKLEPKMRRLVANENVYNKLASVWLSLNFPVQEGTVVSYETLEKQLVELAIDGRKYKNEFIFKSFYYFASEMWKSLDNPHLDTIRTTILNIVAKTVNRTNHFSDESVGTALYNMITMLIEKRRELVSPETFLHLVRLSLGEDYFNNQQHLITTACHQYYTFAKTFLLIDFPLATHNDDVLKMIGGFIQDNTFYYGDSTLNFIEKRIDFLLKLAGQENKEYMEDHNITEKAQRILKKIKTLSAVPFKKVEDVIHQVQVTKAYTALDKHLHINDKIDHSIYLTAWGYNLLKENLLQPSLTTFRVITNKAKSQMTVVIDGLDVQLLKKKYTKLHAKYEVLQKCVVIVADETVKLVFDKKALLALEKEGKEELNRLYHELKSLEAEKIAGVGMEYYAKILKKAKQTYSTASKAIYYQKKEIGDQEGARAVRPSNDPEVDAYDNNCPESVTRRPVESAAVEAH